MPEGPEVHIIADKLNSLLAGKVLYKLLVNANTFPEFHNTIKKYLAPIMYDSYKATSKHVKILNVDCKGKFLYFKLALMADGKQEAVRYIGNHLGLTGHWLKTKGKYTQLVLGYLDDSVQYVYYDDMRKFGDFLWLTPAELQKKLASLGPDVVTGFSYETYLQAIDIKSKKPIASIIHDQKIFSGIGNYLRAEILYHADIDPFKTINQLTNVEKKRLYESIIYMSKKIYELGGITTGKYVDPDGKPGKYQPKVYQQDVDTTKVDGQTLYYVVKK